MCSKVSVLKKFSGSKGNSLAVDSKRKRVYINDFDELYIYTLSGKLVKKITVPNGDRYTSMMIDTHGNIYALANNNSVVRKFSPSGKLLLSFGGKGAYNGKFNGPNSLAIDKDNNIYIADAGNYRIQKFDSTGNFLTKWGSKAPTGNNQPGIYEFRYIVSVGVDKDLNVYVIDDKNFKNPQEVKKFHSDGDYISRTNLKLNNSYNMYSNVIMDTLGNFYHHYGDSIRKFNKNLHLLDAWGNEFLNMRYGRGEHAELLDMVFDSQNNMYTLDIEKYSVQKFSKTGKYIRSWGEWGKGIGQFYTPRGMVINSFNEIYVLDGGSYDYYSSVKIVSAKILRYNRDGKRLQTISLSKLEGEGYDCKSIAIDRYNRLYIAHAIGSSMVAIDVLDRHGKKLKELKIPIKTGQTININIDIKKNLLYLHSGTKVLKCTLEGKILTGWDVSARSQMLFNNGNLGYVYNNIRYDRTLKIYSNSGVLLKTETLPENSNLLRQDKFGSLYASTATTIYKNPVNPDIDHDGVPNEKDAFPFNSHEWVDTDHDGIGNNADTDDDNDGLSDAIEKKYKLNPLNPSDAQADFDHDGFSNTIEISMGTNLRSAKSKPVWTPIMMGDIMVIVPAKP